MWIEQKALKYLNELMYHIHCIHCDMSGKHRYKLNPSDYPLISEIKTWLYEEEGNITMNDESIEKLAKYAHDAWSGWMTYLFENSKLQKDGTVIIPKWAVDRWVRQMRTGYEYLSEEEKNSDRKEALKIIEIVNEVV